MPSSCDDGQGCLCKKCLMRWSCRCLCKCKEQGCHGGYIFNQVRECERYIEYIGSQIKECLTANVQIFQDGFIHCSMLDCDGGCERCLREWEEAQQRLDNAMVTAPARTPVIKYSQISFFDEGVA